MLSKNLKTEKALDTPKRSKIINQRHLMKGEKMATLRTLHELPTAQCFFLPGDHHYVYFYLVCYNIQDKMAPAYCLSYHKRSQKWVLQTLCNDLQVVPTDKYKLEIIERKTP